VGELRVEEEATAKSKQMPRNTIIPRSTIAAGAAAAAAEGGARGSRDKSRPQSHLLGIPQHVLDPALDLVQVHALHRPHGGVVHGV
jgi:hypothetical protein